MAPPYTVDHNLTIVKRTVQPPALNGQTDWIQAFGRVGWLKCEWYATNTRSQMSYVPAATPVDWAYWKTKALGNLNPYRPTIDAPLALFELREFPSMVRQLGRVLSGNAQPGDVPGGYLAYQFGWAPLVSDVISLFNLAESIDGRSRFLRNLEQGNRVQRKLFSGTIRDQTTTDGYTTIPLNTGVHSHCLKADVRLVETLEVWMTANGKLKFPLPTTPGGLKTLSHDMVLGLTLSPERVWDFLPWSWLIDYFLNMGDYIDAVGGRAYLQTTRLCLMAHIKVVNSLTRIRLATGLTCSANPRLEREEKRRTAYANPTPLMAFTPFLTGVQTSILGALATSHALKGVKR